MMVDRKAVDPGTVWCKAIGSHRAECLDPFLTLRTGTRCCVTHTVQKTGYKYCLGNDNYLSMSIYIYMYVVCNRSAGSLATGRKFS